MYICYTHGWGNEFMPCPTCNPPSITTANTHPIPESKEPQGEDKAILDDAKIDGFIIGWFNEWCKNTKRSGGVLITTSIKELLKDFYKEVSGQSTPQKEGEQEELWVELFDRIEDITNGYVPPYSRKELKQSFTISRND